MDGRRPGATHAFLTGASLLGLGIAVFGTGLRDRLASGLDEIDQADPLMLGLAALAFASGLVCCGLAWRAGLEAAGAGTSAVDATSRYVTGSLVNSLVPFRAGGAVRLTLYLRVARSVRVVAGVAASIGASRAAALAMLVVAASAAAPVPAWPGAVLVAAATAASIVAVWLGRSFAALRDTAGWVGAAILARVGGATFVALAFDSPNTIVAGLAAVAAMELASTLPLTPGNVALSTAAVAFVLTALGLPSGVALAAGLTLAMVETATSVVLGIGGLAYLVGTPAHVRRAAGRLRVRLWWRVARATT